jgi:hypothetical protein
MQNDIEGRPPRGASVWMRADGTMLPVPYIKVPALFAKTHRRGGCVQAVFQTLIGLSNGHSWFQAAYQTIQRHAGYGKQQVIRAIKRLESEKWIEVSRYRRPGSSLNDVNEYRILHPKSPPRKRKHKPPKPCA